MVLSCSRSGTAVVEAKRSAGNRVWVISAPGTDVEDQTVETEEIRGPVVDAMIALAFEVLPHEGIEVHVPSRRLHPDQAAEPHYASRVHYELLSDGSEVPAIHMRDES